MTVKTKARRPVRRALVLLLTLLVFLGLYNVVLGYLPFAKCLEVDDLSAIEARVDAMMTDVDSPDHAAILESSDDALQEQHPAGERQGRLLRRAVFSLFQSLEEHLSPDPQEEEERDPGDEAGDGGERFHDRVHADPAEHRHGILEKGVYRRDAAHLSPAHAGLVQPVRQGHRKRVHREPHAEGRAVRDKEEIQFEHSFLSGRTGMRFFRRFRPIIPHGGRVRNRGAGQTRYRTGKPFKTVADGRALWYNPGNRQIRRIQRQKRRRESAGVGPKEVFTWHTATKKGSGFPSTRPRS